MLAETATGLVPLPGSVMHFSTFPYPVPVPHSNLQSVTFPPLGLTVAFSVADVLAISVAFSVTTVGAFGSVLSVSSEPLLVPEEFVAEMRKW